MTGDFIETTVVGHTLDGVEIVNTYWYLMAPGSPPPDLATFQSSFQGLVFATFRSMVTLDWVGSSITSTVRFGPSLGMTYTDLSIAGVAGALALPAHPSAVCLVVKRQSGFATRQGQGRLFLSPIQAAVFDNAGKLIATPAGTAAFVAAVTSVLLDLGGNTYSPVTLHKVPLGGTPIVAAALSQRAGSQKRRRVPDL